MSSYFRGKKQSGVSNPRFYGNMANGTDQQFSTRTNKIKNNANADKNNSSNATSNGSASSDNTTNNQIPNHKNSSPSTTGQSRIRRRSAPPVTLEGNQKFEFPALFLILTGSSRAGPKDISNH